MTIDLLQVKNILDSHLGRGTTHKNGEISYYCPFCNHYKKKLQVNVITQKYHCWVCSSRGLTIGTLLKKSNAPIESYQKIKSIYGESISKGEKQTSSEFVSLPEEYKPLYRSQSDPHYKNALHYAMKERGLTAVDILRHRVGYCDSGPYSGMLIIPSYDASNNLNFFVGRSFYKDAALAHKNPSVSKDIIGFENQINWNEPIIIVEGAFDAISTKRNAIPLFGKKILGNLRKKVITNKVQKIYLGLDKDAFEDSVKEIEYFINNGVNVYLINLKDKDPSETGYSKMAEAINNAQPVTFFDLIKYKMLI
jgi:DNA primase